jgi:DedD protein
MTDDRSRGVHLTDKQLVFVVMAATVVAVVIFLFGVLVGRGVPPVRGQAADGAMMTPTQVVSDGADPLAADPPPPVPPAGSATSGSAAGTSPRPVTDLSYDERLGKKPPADELKPPAVAKPAAAGAEIAPPDPPDEAGGPPADASASGAVDFTIQIAWVKKRAEADTIIRALKAKGYDARVYVPEGRDPAGGFRIRVGFYKTRREAEAIAQKLARDTGYQTWITR